jgi:hypothetical protein
MNNNRFLDLARNTHGYKYKYIDLPDKIKYTDYINIDFNGEIFTQRVNKHLSGKCPEKNTPKKTTYQFIEESIKIWGDRFDYSKTEYNGSLNKVIIFDKKSGIFVSQLPTLHLSKHESKYVKIDDFINMSKLISDYVYEYSKCNYINKTTSVTLICRDHGDFNILPYNHLNYGDGCKNCITTLFNKEITRFLNKHKISYNRQHKFTECRNIYQLPFDFYIPSVRTCIEFYSEQHYKPESLDKLKTNDKIKNDYCEDNYIDLIRIRYDQIDRIFDILKESLKNKI